MPLKVVLTGGPCAGKTSVQDALKNHFSSRVLCIPEVATLLMKNDFPQLGADPEYAPRWHQALMAVSVPLYIGYEDMYALFADKHKTPLIVSDRGILDCTAYLEGGKEALLAKFPYSLAEIHARYDLVIHLESLATARPRTVWFG
jgi:predicted ATPase